MKPHVVSFEMAIKLKDAGCPQGKSGWFYIRKSNKSEEYVLENSFADANIDRSACIDAYSVGELGEMLVREGEPRFPRYDAIKGIWFLNWPRGIQIHKDFDSEADARASMKLYLMEKR